MTWIQTYTGKRFWPLAPRVVDIDIRDISHALARVCRFGGHCTKFYSVAQHSALVAWCVGHDGGDETLMRWGLLHDAGEAYLSDVARPIKGAFPMFQEVEDRLLRCIAERFDLPWPMPDAVKVADDRLLATEARDIMVAPPEPWKNEAEPYPFPLVSLAPPGCAERIWVETLHLCWRRDDL